MISLLVLTALATTPDMYGMGARNVGRAGASTALADDAWSTFYNPAGVARLRHISLEASYIVGQHRLQSFERIVYDRDGDGRTTDEDGFAEIGPVGTDYRARLSGANRPLDTDGIMLGIGYPLGWRFGFGIGVYLPREGLLRLEPENPSIPYYVMYQNRNNRFTLSPAFAFQIVDGLSIGLGAQVGAKAKLYASANVTADIDAFSSESEEGTDLDANIALDIRAVDIAAVPTVQPVVGLQLNFGAFAPNDAGLKGLLERFGIGATYRGVWRVDTVAQVVAGVNGTVRFDDDTLLLSTLLEEPLDLTIEDLTAFYNPPTVSLGVTGGYDIFQFSLDAVWTKWSGFRPLAVPAGGLGIDALAGVSIQVDLGTDLPPPSFHDTWTLRTGFDLALPLMPSKPMKAVGSLEVGVHGGYAFVPSPVPEQTGLSNYMDADRHVAALGLGLQLGKLNGVSKGPIRFDLAGQYHQLVRTTSVKVDGLVSDTDGDGRLDYPSGYALDGELTAAGHSWVVMGTISLLLADPTEVRKPKGKKKKRRETP